MSMEEKIGHLERERTRLADCGGKEAVEKQHAKGKYSARERLAMLLDPGSFHEVGLFAKHQCVDFGMDKTEIPADGVVTGYGRIDGRKVFVYAQDFTAYGGSMGKMQTMKICRILDLAAGAGAPVVGINDSGGARVQEGVDGMAGLGDLFRRISRNSGRIPQITMIMGPCAGGAAYAPAMTDLVVMRKGQGLMFCTGPGVIRDMTGDTVDAQDLGGAAMHAKKSGEVHLVAETEEEAFLLVRRVLGYLPSSCAEKPPRKKYEASSPELRPALESLVPDNRRKPYNMLDVISQITDEGSFLELQPLFADNLIIGFARIAGRPVGIVANQPLVKAGCLDMDAADKASAFVSFCDAFRIPLISLVDVPGFLPGVDQEQLGLLRHGAKLLYAFSVAQVPCITVILRKAYGGAYMAMCSREMGADLVLAWPSAEIAVMGAESAVNLVCRREIAAAADPDEKREQLAAEYAAKFSSPYFAAGRGYIDAVIRPQETRAEIISALELLEDKPFSGRGKGAPV